MSESDLDEEFERIVSEIFDEKPNLNEDEQNIVEAWVSKLREIEDDGNKPIRQEYIRLLRSQLARDPKRLSVPFINMPPSSSLPSLQDLMQQDRTAGAGGASRERAVPERSRYFCSVEEKKPPCRPRGTVAKKYDRPMSKGMKNEFENPEEMAKSIARSKGMMLAEFVADISRHTADKGHELRLAMKAESTSFNEYVERIVTQRIKDIGELLDDKQTNELLKIQKDYEKWQAELSVCKRRLKELVPDFNIESYRKDKNYFRKIFSVSLSNPPDEDKFKEWKEENCHRLMWFVREIEKLTEENNEVLEAISSIKSNKVELQRKETEKHRCLNNQLQEESRKNKVLQEKSDKLAKDIADLLLSLEN